MGRSATRIDHLGSTAVLGKAGESAPFSNSAARYAPFGDWRTEPAQTVTDMGYTGHRHDNLAANDLGLIYMNARYYLPHLGRFASPDTLVPDPANPQAFNRYGYIFNNPLRYTDPTGHCPAPTQENGFSGGGNIICVSAFIPTAESEGPLGMIYEGDERWFSENSRIDGSRFWVWIDTSSGRIIMSFVQATTAVNDLGSVLGRLGNCDGNKCTYPQSTSTNHILSYPVGEDGTIVLEYSVLCSHPTCYLGPGPDGNIAFIPNDTGSFYAVGITEKFPNLEAYYWEDGKLKDTLFRINHFS